jgi:hypothetical protein
MQLKRLVVALMALMLVAAGPATAAPTLDFSDDRTPDPYIHEDVLTVAEHDTNQMSSLTQYYDDGGNVADLPATVNQSQDTPAGVRFDKIDSSAYRLFPRVSGESDNSATWTNSSKWTKSSGGTSDMTISDADGTTASGVPAVSADGNVSAGETATATYADNVSITSDADKRVLAFVGNVDKLSSGATVEIRAVDADGDYRFAEVNASADASDEAIVANGTGNGFFYQEKLANLPMAGSGDGSMQEIQQIDVVAVENDAKVTIVGLDADRKGEYNIGDVAHDRNNDGETTVETIQDYHEGGTANVSSVDSLGAYADGASIKDLKVYDVEYRVSDLEDSEDHQVEFSEAEDYGGYDTMLEMTARLSAPTAIDLSHGTLELRDDQGLVGDRFKVAEYATNQGDTEFGNVSDGDYTDVSGKYSSKGETVTLATSGINAGENLIINLEVALSNDEADAMQSQPAAAGPVGGGGGGIVGFLMSPLGLAGGLVGAAVAYAKGWIPVVGGG